ncbi:putative diguanylate cyclase YdaM [Desulfosporosinus acididurans]|uniref:Putative diguanylate cyclase YdaM n=1 Tax=Desulfosporosinus acididurans TaxID=476652 RepID=A0A0J1IKN3_9FIRM|nr:diguanylate cyclase [Desulfosporosinus acididurans]KLU65281.1 putative diguanylate cyclase YdaM [Desulfosporosinus acididurans]
MDLVAELTKRRVMEGELQEKETTLSTVLDAVRDAIAILDDHGNVTFWNTAAEKLFGYPQEEILGKDLHLLVVPEEHLYETYSKAYNHFKTTGKGNAIGKIMEFKAKHKDGRTFVVELSLSAMRIKNTWHSVGIVRDITERKQEQEELKNSRQKYLELTENAPIGIISCDYKGNIIYVNQIVLEILGSTSIEETKKINLLTFPLLVRHGLSRQLEECLKSNKSAMHEINYESKWGKKVWLRIHIKPRKNRNTVIGAQVIIDDISERKQLEEKLFLLSITDSLTSVYNRRFFIQKLEEEIERVKRTGRKFSVIMMDIDHFKCVNDRFGHNCGDFVLRKIMSETIKKIRKIDTLARWGGEEFIILLPETTINKAVVLGEKLRERLSRMDIPNVGNVTASFGVAEYNPGDTVDTIVQKADDMMYQAKSAGRNCVRYIRE